MNNKTYLGLMMVLFSMVFLPNAMAQLTNNTWDGSSSDDWFTAANWSLNTVPTTSHRALIPNTGNQPVISGYSKAYCGELKIGSGGNATLTIQDGAELEVNNGSGNAYVGDNYAGYLYLTGGTLHCNNCTVKSGAGWGQVEAEAGRLLCEGTLTVNGRVNCYYFGGSAIAETVSIAGGAAIELKRGRLITFGDDQSAIASYIGTGNIYGNGATGSVLYDYDISQPGNTTVYATTKTVSNPLSYSNQSNLTIQNLFIRNANGPGVTLNNCNNVTITNCEFQGCQDNAIDITSGYNIYVNHNTIRDSGGACIFYYTTGNAQFTYNWCLNDSRDGVDWRTRSWFWFCFSSGAGNKCNYNTFENILDQNISWDVMNAHNSNGTSNSYLEINNNKVRCAGTPDRGGAGIVLGDMTGQYQEALSNTLVTPGENGMSVSGGSYTIISGNTIFGDRYTNPTSWKGIVLWDWVPNYNCYYHWHSYNHVKWTDIWGYSDEDVGFCNYEDTCSPVYDNGNNDYCDSSVTKAILPGNLFTAAAP